MNDYGYVDPIAANRYCKSELQKALEDLKKDINERDFDLDEFDEIVKNTIKNYKEDFESINFELILKHYNGDIHFYIDEHDFTIVGSRYGDTVFDTIYNKKAHKKLYNKLLDFCK